MNIYEAAEYSKKAMSSSLLDRGVVWLKLPGGRILAARWDPNKGGLASLDKDRSGLISGQSETMEGWEKSLPGVKLFYPEDLLSEPFLFDGGSTARLYDALGSRLVHFKFGHRSNTLLLYSFIICEPLRDLDWAVRADGYDWVIRASEGPGPSIDVDNKTLCPLGQDSLYDWTVASYPLEDCSTAQETYDEICGFIDRIAEIREDWFFVPA